MELTAPEREAVETLRRIGRIGASLFAMASAERLRPLLQRVPSGSPPLVAGVALTQLWRVLEGLERADPRRLTELSQSCWTLVEIEPTPEVPAAHLELLVAAAHHALETYLSGNPEQAIEAARKITAAAALSPDTRAPAAEAARQARDLAELAHAKTLAPLGTRLRERAEQEGAKFVEQLLPGKRTTK